MGSAGETGAQATNRERVRFGSDELEGTVLERGLRESVS
jgi:hypothetical protein